MADIAYTLQTGREAMEERLGMTAVSIGELEEKLRGYVEGREDIEELYKGQVKREKETLGIFTADEELQEAIEKWVQRRKYNKLLDLWVKGLAFNWERIYGDSRPRKISLPTYPFARERYWLAGLENKLRVEAKKETRSRIHPLLQENTSDLSEQRYSSIFTGEEFFLRDHVIKGEKILPGVAYLEMARKAVEESVPGGEDRIIKLKNVIWAIPIGVNGSRKEVQVGIYPEEDGEISYEIYSETGGEEVVHSQGRAGIYEAEAEAERIDIERIKRESKKTIAGSKCYEIYRRIGMEYGGSHQAISEIYTGTETVLARLTLPEIVKDTREEYVLHPSIMDGALQATIGLAMGNGYTNDAKEQNKPSLPFALEELEIYSPCVEEMWAVIKKEGESQVGDRIQKLDIDICDGEGKVCIRMKRFTSRILERDIERKTNPGTLLLEQVWKEEKADKVEGKGEYSSHHVILIETENITPKAIEQQISGVRSILFQSDAAIDKRYEIYAVQLFEEIQSILKNKSKDKVLVQVVIPDEADKLVYAGLSGLTKTAKIENPRIMGQTIEIERGENAEGIADKLKENSRTTDTKVRYKGGRRYIESINAVSSIGEKADTEEVNIPWKEGGVYLITGGAGGLGLIFAEEIAGKVKDIRVIITGRSKLSEEKKSRIKEIESKGAKIEYREVDVTDRQRVVELIDKIEKDYGFLNGIIHSAGIIRDNFIIKKTKEEFEQVLRPKVSGLVNIDEATKDKALDFIIIFSSIAGVFGNIGQADYAAANAFMDAYAGYRNELEKANKRHGRTLSLNWPLWEEGGMHIDEESKKMIQRAGTAAISTERGIKAFYKAFGTDKNQTIVLEGDPEQLKTKIIERQFEEKESKQVTLIQRERTVSDITKDNLEEKAVNYFKRLLSKAIKLSPDRIEADAPMEKYGIDSVIIMGLTNELEKTFGSLSKTLFFEYNNIQELTKYFIESYKEKLISLLGMDLNRTEDIEEKE